jgi:predicted nucleic acid-binding protein
LAVIVPDASVILKWVLAGDDEPAQTAAVEIRDRWLNEADRIIVPSLWLYEVGNVLGTKAPEYATSLMGLLLDYGFEEAAVDASVCRMAIELMDACRVSFYDAAYHAVAVSAGATFVTADERYFKKAGDRGHVKLLADGL